MLGLLHDEHDEHDDTVEPSPGLRHLDDLVARAGPGSSAIRLQVQPELELPRGLELAIYRIVQEALTNLVKHAPGAAANVSIRAEGEQLLVAVTNAACPRAPANPPVGAGRGLVGIRERAALYNGCVTAGPTADGGFSVTVAFPAATGKIPRESIHRVETPT